MINIKEKWKRKSDGVVFIISADRYGKGARYVELEPENDGEIFWLMDAIVELDFEKIDDSQKLEEIRQITQSWLDQQGHNRCWYYPELFQKLATVLNLKIEVDPSLPPKSEFEEGCKKYQQEEYGDKK
jgi:hypothetical protein